MESCSPARPNSRFTHETVGTRRPSGSRSNSASSPGVQPTWYKRSTAKSRFIRAPSARSLPYPRPPRPTSTKIRGAKAITARHARRSAALDLHQAPLGGGDRLCGISAHLEQGPQRPPRHVFVFHDQNPDVMAVLRGKNVSPLHCLRGCNGHTTGHSESDILRCYFCPCPFARGRSRSCLTTSRHKPLEKNLIRARHIARGATIRPTRTRPRRDAFPI